MTTDNDLRRGILQDQIEIALEEFEEITHIEITGITFERIEMNEKETGKEFEYTVQVSWKP